MNYPEFKDLLETLRERQSELDDVEAKEASKGIPQKLWESISALANRPGGGTIILGVNNVRFEIVGVPDVDELQRSIGNTCSEMVPPVRITASIFTEEKKKVLVISVPECPREHKPCYHGPSGMTAGSFTRVGDSDRRMTDYEIQSCIAERGQPQEDIRAVENLAISDLQMAKVEEFFADLRRRQPNLKHLSEPVEDLMVRYRIAKPVGGTLRPTVAGVLMFGRYPQEQFPNLCMTIVRYGGPRNSTAVGADTIVDNQRIEGTLSEIVEEAMGILRRNMRRGTLKTGLLAEDIWEYPETALREVLMNAIAHRDYGPWAAGSQIQIKMFSDALVIQNPGGLYGPVNEETLDEINVQAARNSHLMRLLESKGLVENRGSGIRTVIAQLSKAGLPPPTFKDNRTYFRVTFLNETLLDPGTIDWLNKYAGYPISDKQRRALAYLKRFKSMRNKDYSRLNACDSRLATAELSQLRELGILRQSGTRGGTIYFLADEHRPEMIALPGGVRPRHAKVLAFLREQGEKPASVKTIAKKLKMNPVTVRLAIRELVRARIVLPTEEKAKSSRQAYRLASL